MHRAKLTVAAPDRGLVDALLTPAAFEHPVAELRMIETHISWIVLAGEYVYKIKKPLVLDFLDFGDLERRRFYCEEEIRLNQPTAPEIYIDVVPITLVDGQPRFGGGGEPLEYAVRMHRFDQRLRLDRQLHDGLLTVADMQELGQVVAARHAAAARVDTELRDHQVAVTQELIWDNFRALDEFVEAKRLQSLAEWTKRELARIEPALWQRFDDGQVRDCHGDLHLSNLVRLPSGITTFDCIEFNTDLRNIDVMCDVAFLAMDLVARERHDLAAHFLNRYLECSGDYTGVALLDLYFVYRCLVLAKVAAINSQECLSQKERDAQLVEVDRYTDIAWRQVHKRAPVLVVMHGYSGSGKTWLAERLMDALPAIRIRSDIERKRLFRLGELADSASGVGTGIYTDAATAHVYAVLFDFARTILGSGHNVILDAAFLRRKERDSAFRLAADAGCAAVLLHPDAPTELLRSRLIERAAARHDASEAGLAVLEHQLESSEPLDEDERARAIACENVGGLDIAQIVGEIRGAAWKPGSDITVAT